MEGKIVSNEEVQSLIEHVCAVIEQRRRDGLRAFGIQKLQNEQGILFQFGIHSGCGLLACTYDPAPAVAASLQHGDRHTAFADLLAILQILPESLLDGAENAFDLAQVNSKSVLAASNSVQKKSPQRYPHEDIKKALATARERIEARSKRLLNMPGSGPEREVTEERMGAAIGWLRVESVSEDQITVGYLANRLRCTEAAIYQQLKRQKETLKEFISRCS